MESNRLETCADPAVRAGIGRRNTAWLEAEEVEADRPGGGRLPGHLAVREGHELAAVDNVPGSGQLPGR